MYRSFRRRVTSDDEKQAIQRGVELGLGHRDIAYFLGLKEYVVRTNPIYKNQIIPTEKQLSYPCVGSHPSIIHRVPLRDISQMYEASDAGFSVLETVELFRRGKMRMYGESQITFFLEEREKIQPRIVEVLQLFYNNPTGEKPYRKSI